MVHCVARRVVLGANVSERPAVVREDAQQLRRPAALDHLRAPLECHVDELAMARADGYARAVAEALVVAVG